MARWGTCNFRELKKLQEQIEAIERGKDEFCWECSKELAARLLAMVKSRTPVGHKPKLQGPRTQKVKGAGGKSRSFLTAEGARMEKYWAGYAGGRLRDSWTAGEIIRKGDLFEIEVINPMEYASYVEYGHRQEPGRYVPAIGKTLKKAWVPGTFMLTISEKKIQGIAPGLLEKMLAEYLRRCLDGAQ